MCPQFLEGMKCEEVTVSQATSLDSPRSERQASHSRNSSWCVCAHESLLLSGMA